MQTSPIHEPADTDRLDHDSPVHAPLPSVAADEGGAHAPDAPPRHWLAPALALLAVAGWSALVLARHVAGLEAPAAIMLEWCPPVVLVLALYLALRRPGVREAGRYAEAAAALNRESLALEARLAGLNRELSLAREFLAAQGRDLDALGRQAVERIGQHAGHLAALVQDNAARVEALGSVSTTAVGNMERLREGLPVLAAAARDVASNIGNAGRVAESHTEALTGAFARLSEHGSQSRQTVERLTGQLAGSLADLEARSRLLADSISARFEALEARSAGFALDLERHEGEARDTLRARAAALGEEVDKARHLLDESEAAALTSLRARLSALRDEGAVIARALREGESASLAQWNASLANLSEEMARLDGEVSERHAAAIAQAQGLATATEATTQRLTEAETRIAALAQADTSAAAALENRLGALEAGLAASDATLARMSATAGQLLSDARDALPAALAAQESGLAAHAGRVSALLSTMEATRVQGEALSEQVEWAEQALRDTGANLTTLHDSLAARVESHADALASLRTQLAEVDNEAQALAAHAEGDLRHALSVLAEALARSVQAIETEGAARIRALAAQLSGESTTALEASMRTKAAEIGGRLEQAAAHAAGVGREAAQQLADEITRVDTLANALEQRVADARAAAQTPVDNDLARHMATITDTLNSAAVDITGALDSEVADTAWAAYLRGDRGIFTRRAVRLLSAADARTVLALYESDAAFQARVNRYIHDFEAMLRHLLATRDGHAVSVTLLSSDMGKLYVALAQAIERLRG